MKEEILTALDFQPTSLKVEKDVIVHGQKCIKIVAVHNSRSHHFTFANENKLTPRQMAVIINSYVKD